MALYEDIKKILAKWNSYIETNYITVVSNDAKDDFVNLYKLCEKVRKDYFSANEKFLIKKHLDSLNNHIIHLKRSARKIDESEKKLELKEDIQRLRGIIAEEAWDVCKFIY